MGLLDPTDAALLSLGAGLLGGGSRAQAMGRGAQGFMSTYQAAAQAQAEQEQKARELAMQEELRKAQILEYQSQARQREAQTQALAMKERQAQQRLQSLPSVFGQAATGDANMPGAPATGQFNPIAAMQAGWGVDDIPKLQNMPNLGRQKVARTIETMVNGRPVQIQVDEYGQPVGDPLAQWKAPVQVNQGDRVTFVDPTQPPSMLGINQSPDSKASNAVSIRGQDITMRGQDLVNARSQEANSINAAGNVIKTETEVRKEFNDLPEVKNYKIAFPAYKAISDAATRNTPQADISLIYGLAKLYDPTSVVREGEYNTIANSQAIPEWLKGQAQRVMGGGKLTPETKRQIMTEATGRVVTYQTEFEKAQKTYESIVKDRGGDPSKVFTPVGEKVQQTRSVKRTGTYNGKKVIEYSDGSVEYAN